MANNKPFNLAEAIAGKPVVTRDGKKTIFVQHNANSDGIYTLFFRVIGSGQQVPCSFTEEGKYSVSVRESRYDLLMAPDLSTEEEELNNLEARLS
jgi:hypothetical protein